MKGKYLYRYDYVKWGQYDTPRLCLKEYPILRETPKGYWIDMGYLLPSSTRPEKWVAKNSGGFAQETMEAALKRFILRKRNYRAILGGRYDETTEVINIAQTELAKMTGQSK